MSNVAFGSQKKLSGPSCGLQERLRAGPVGEEKRQASDRPQRGRGRDCRLPRRFEGGARGCLTLPSEAHRKSFLGQAAACRNVCGRGPWVKRRGRLRTGHREAAAGLPAAEEGLRAGGCGCLTLPSEAHKKSFLGQAAACRNVCGRGPWAKRRGRLRTGHREAAAGLPAAEEGLRAGPVGGCLTSPSEAHRKSFLG